MNVLVTGAAGFIGSNLCEWLRQRADVTLLMFDRGDADRDLREHLAVADFVYHLAGVMRPDNEGEFETVNVGLTKRICEHLLNLGRAVPIAFTSSVQAMLDNAYGKSKNRAKKVLIKYAGQSGARITVYELTNVFGKWAKPNYTSVVATFCHNIARDLPILISNPEHSLELVYIDDVVHRFITDLDISEEGVCSDVTPVYQVTLGCLSELLISFRDMRRKLVLPDLSDEFIRKLYGTYLSHLDPSNLSYALDKRCDDRGCLAEFIKSNPAGQSFVSRTTPGAIRGNHYHRTKAEKFLVLDGQAVVRLQHVLSGEMVTYNVNGTDLSVIDIPPGLNHSIENVGTVDLVTLFWASEVFDPQNPDTYGVR